MFIIILAVSKMASESLKLDEAALNRVATLSKKGKFFVWMHTPGDFITLDEVLSLRKEYDISSSVIINKIIYNLVSNGFNFDQIIKYLKDENILKIYNLEKIKKIIEDCFAMDHTPIKASQIDNVLALQNSFKKPTATKTAMTLELEKKMHGGYPLPDPKRGRPHLQWNKCYHGECHKKFDTIEMLKDHLEKLGKLTHGLHKFHEDYVKLYALTPTIVKAKKMTKCPSWVCDKSDEEMTPEELCEHFKILGIYPFWKPGMVILPEGEEKDTDPSKKEKLDKDVYDNLFVSNNCLICLDENPQVIFLPCNHHVSCFSCSTSFSICPVCRTKITRKLPF